MVRRSARRPRCCGPTDRRSRCSPPGSSPRGPGSRAAPCTPWPARWPPRACSRSCPVAATGWVRCWSGWPGRSSNGPGWSPRWRARSARCCAPPGRRCTSASWSAAGSSTCTGRPGRCGRRWTTGSGCGRRPGGAGAARRRWPACRSPRSTPGCGGSAGRRARRPPDLPALHAELAAGRERGYLVSSSFQAGRTSVAAAVVGATARSAGCRWPGRARCSPPTAVRRLGPDVAEAAGRAGTAAPPPLAVDHGAACRPGSALARGSGRTGGRPGRACTRQRSPPGW